MPHEEFVDDMIDDMERTGTYYADAVNLNMPLISMCLSDFKRKVLNIKKKEGYELRKEEIDDGHGTTLVSAYNPNGSYIGDAKTAKFLVDKKGIAPIKQPGADVCSIGFCEKEQKWYGWSHRAIYGFKVGDKVSKGDITAHYLPVGFQATTLEAARKMAEAFAKDVS